MRVRPVLVALAALALAGPAAPAAAQQLKYGVDHALDHCRSLERRHTALAVAETEAYDCAFGYRTIEEARSSALRNCNNHLPRNIRRAMPCRIVYEDGRITDQRFVTHFRRDYRVATRLELFDADRNVTETFAGHLVLGRSPNVNSRTLRIYLSNGALICDGLASFTRSFNYIFDATCFGRHQLRGEGRIAAYRTVNGYRHPMFDLTLRRGRTYLKISER